MAAADDTRHCLTCNGNMPKDAPGQRRYCSSQCTADAKKRKKNNRLGRPTMGTHCIQCSAEIKGRPRKYCSEGCRYAAQNRHERVRDNRRERWQAEVGKGETSLSFEDWKLRPESRLHSQAKLMDRLAERNAKQAWEYWLKVMASDQWHADYWGNTDKPWNNPRISVAEKFTLRYELDQKFRAKELERRRLFKWSHPEVVAMQENDAGNRRRWNQAAIKADGTITKNVVKELLRQKLCPYCLARLTKDNLQIDHVTPLSQDGAHSITNVVACCSSCNRSKGARKLWQWALSSRCVYAKAA